MISEFSSQSKLPSIFIPIEWFDELTVTEAVVYSLLSKRYKSGYRPSQQDIADELHITDRTIRYVVKSLQKKNFLKVIKYEGERGNEYELLV